MTPPQHGWYLVDRPSASFVFPRDPPTTPANFNCLPTLHIPRHVETLRLSHVLATRPGIDSRATLVLLGFTKGGGSRVVKLTWLSEYRAQRYERVLEHIKKTPIPGVPVALYVDTLGQNKDTGGAERFSTRELVKFAAGSSADALLNQDDFPDRRLLCVITDRPGVTIAKEVSLGRVFNTCAEVVERECVLDSYILLSSSQTNTIDVEILVMEESGIYHRDVSIGNIFTRKLKLPSETSTSEDSAVGPDSPRGWLDDFDCAFIHSASLDVDIKHRDALLVRQGAVDGRRDSIHFIFDREQCHLCQQQSPMRSRAIKHINRQASMISSLSCGCYCGSFSITLLVLWAMAGSPVYIKMM